jgi:hypothetical protein
MFEQMASSEGQIVTQGGEVVRIRESGYRAEQGTWQKLLFTLPFICWSSWRLNF